MYVNLMETELDRYKKIVQEIDTENLNVKLDSPESLEHLVCNINKFLTKRLEDRGGSEALKWFLKTMKKYKVLLTIMHFYVQNKSTYKEEIIKNLNKYSYKTISQIVDEALEKKFINYIKNSTNGDNKTKLIVPSVDLLISYINWNNKHISNYSNAIKRIPQ